MSLRHGHRFITCKQWFVCFCVACLVLNKELIRNRSGDLKGFFHIWWQKCCTFPLKLSQTVESEQNWGFGWETFFICDDFSVKNSHFYVYMIVLQSNCSGRAQEGFLQPARLVVFACESFPQTMWTWRISWPSVVMVFFWPLTLCMQTRMPCFTGVFLGVPQGYLKHSITPGMLTHLHTCQKKSGSTFPSKPTILLYNSP